MDTGMGRGRGGRGLADFLRKLDTLDKTTSPPPPSSIRQSPGNPAASVVSSDSGCNTRLCHSIGRGFSSMSSMSTTDSGISDLRMLNIGRGRARIASCISSPNSIVSDISQDKSPGCSPVQTVSDLPIFTSGRGIGLSSSLNLSKPVSIRNIAIPSTSADPVGMSLAAIKLEEPPDENPIESNTPVVKLGTSGHQVDISANYLRLSVKPGHGAFEYFVRFDPHVDHRAFKIKMLRAHSSKLGNDLTFDGQALFLPQKLPANVTTFKSAHPVDNSDVIVEVVFVKEKKMSEMTQLYNVLFKKVMMALSFKRIGKDSFDPQHPFMIPQYKLEVWPGYVTTVDDFEGGLMLNIDPSHKVVRTSTVLNEIQEVSYRSQNAQNDIRSALIGKSVLTKYSYKLYTIDDVDFSVNPLSSFKLFTGEMTTFLNYYKKAYGSEILDLKQPLLISRLNRRIQKPTPQDFIEEKLIYLVPELCISTGLTDNMRQDFTLMKDLAQFMKITPNQRYQALKKFVSNIEKNPNASKFLTNWGLSLDSFPVSLVARTLPPEIVCFGHKSNPNQKTEIRTSNAEWSKEASLYPVIAPVDIINWVVLHTLKDERTVKEFCDCLIRCGQPAGIKIAQPQMIGLRSDTTQEYVNNLRSVIKPHLQMVVCFCPTSRDDRYSAIKKICCVDFPVPSQIINGPTMRKKNVRAIAHKVLLQMNCKLGGSLWAIPIPYKRLMVIGIDVYHSAESSNKNSVGGFVASYNDSLTRWYSRVCFQSTHQEIVDKIKICLLDALKLYLDHNGLLPDRIIIYRDGIGNGQFNVCSNHELPQIEMCFATMGQNYSPSLTFIIVQKRHSARIFENCGPNKEVTNPSPGTVIDSMVTRKYLYDFYVVSHKTRQGSLVPTHYIVLKDTSNMEPDHVQRITFKMCHLYFNWPGTVRVPAPCQYAHKLAFLMGASVKKEHSPILADKLFFL
ncbi:argonaute 3 [Arctopsyche grandis]|uniref:argonaute 3 n=1 Tax=Arctopsyche grandis TaxID=121162 RepID=UPI00406D8523